MTAKYVFNNRFDGPVVEGRVIDSFYQNLVDKAREEGFIAGKDEVRQELKDLLNHILENIQETLQLKRAEVDCIINQTADIAHQMVKKLYPHLAQKIGFDEVKIMIHEVMQKFQEPVKLKIHIHESLVALLDEEIKQKSDAMRWAGYTSIIGHSDLALSECKMEWSDGGIEVLSARIMESFDDILKQHYEIEISESVEVLESIDVSPQAEVSQPDNIGDISHG